MKKKEPDTYKIEDMYLKQLWIIVADRTITNDEIREWTLEAMITIKILRKEKGII